MSEERVKAARKLEKAPSCLHTLLRHTAAPPPRGKSMTFDRGDIVSGQTMK